MTDLRERLTAVAIRLRRYAANYRERGKRTGGDLGAVDEIRGDAYADAAAMIQRELDKDQEASVT